MKTNPTMVLAVVVSANAHAASILSAPFTPTLDGSPDPGYLHMTEAAAAGPVTGGDPTNSDFVGESASRYWYDGFAGFSVDLGSNRADIQQFRIAADSGFLYVGLSGPTIGNNSWTGPDGSRSNEDGDQGDLWIAIDTAAMAGGNLGANSTAIFSGDTGPRAVDFQGWSPTHFIGVQYVDNGGGGGGGAGLTVAGGTIVTEGHGLANGGFDWFTDANGNYEFAIPWSSLGYSGMPTSGSMRLGAYTTQNFAGADVYDQGPGQGNGSTFEQIGDFLGDTDTSLPGNPDSDADGPIVGSQPGSNWVDLSTYGGAPSNGDQVDTIGEYWEVNFVPEPSTALLFLASAGLLLRRTRP